MSHFKLAIIGECMIELVGQPFSKMQQNFGGDTMNTAIYLKKLSPNQGKVSYVTVMGEDTFSKLIIGKWWAHGIDIEYVLKDSERNAGIYMILNNASGERSFQYWRNDSAARYLMRHPEAYKVFRELKDYDVIYLSGISLAILPDEDRIKLIQQLKTLKYSGVKIVFDSNYRPKLWQSIPDTQDCYEEIYKLCHLALVTFDDEQALWGDKDIDAAIERLSQCGIPELVLKDGKNGCHYIKETYREHFATDVVDLVVDTTAAGDSFNAGYLYAWLRKQTPQQCAELANKIAGKVIQKKGAIVELPDLEEEILS